MAAPYWDVTVPASTDDDPAKRHPRTNPLVVHEGIRPGVIKGIRVRFRSGCADLVGVQVYHREHILAPADTGEWITGDGTTWEWETSWPVEGAGNYIGIKIYNDGVYEHTISVALSHVPREAIPRTDAILTEIQMILYDVRTAMMAIPTAIQSVVDAVASLWERR